MSRSTEGESGQETQEKGRTERQGLIPCLFRSNVAMYIIPSAFMEDTLDNARYLRIRADIADLCFVRQAQGPLGAFESFPALDSYIDTLSSAEREEYAHLLHTPQEDDRG